MKDKKFIVASMLTVTLLASFTAITINFMNKVFDRAELAKKDELLTKYEELYDRVEGLDSTISSLEESYETNVYRMYGRIVELCEGDPNEIRDAVIGSLMNNAEDSKKLEASILALLENYTEFKSDMEIQAYLNDNVNILESIERYQSIQDTFIESLEEYNKTYLDEDTPTENEKEKG